MSGQSDVATTVSFCWRVERSDGAGIALTSGDRPLIRDGRVFAANPGLLPSAVTRRLGLEPGAGEIEGMLSSEAITETDLALGRWDGASVTLSAIDWSESDPAEQILLEGALGDIVTDGSSFTADLRGASSKLDEPACPTTSSECRADFGDRHCRVDLAGRTRRFVILSTNGNQISLDRPIDTAMRTGRLRYLSGANCGLSTVILFVAGSVIDVRDRPKLPVEEGTIVEIREGCDKRLETCSTRFANAANFRGEPHLPGTDLLTRYPGS